MYACVRALMYAHVHARLDGLVCGTRTAGAREHKSIHNMVENVNLCIWVVAFVVMIAGVHVNACNMCLHASPHGSLFMHCV